MIRYLKKFISKHLERCSYGKIIEFPDNKNLREKLSNLKATLAELVLKRDNLYYVVSENIKTHI